MRHAREWWHGPGEVDVQGAFRTIPVHPDDSRLLGMRWEGRIYVASSEVVWRSSRCDVMDTGKSDGVDGLHYLDDFLVFGAPDSQQCRECWPGMHSWECLWSLGRQKVLAWGWPSWVLRWIHYSWPWACPHRNWSAFGERFAIGRVWSLAPRGSFCLLLASSNMLAVWFGQGDRSCGTWLSSPGVWKSCTTECACFQFDLRWWGCFLPIWNGSCLKASIVRGVSRTVLTSNVLGSWGCGAFTSDGQWFQLQLPACWDGVHITMKGLLPIVLGVAVWDSRWKGLTVTCQSDNAAVVHSYSKLW